MNTPNWQHNSGKHQKRKLKPQALRQAKARRQALKKRFQKGTASFLIYIILNVRYKYAHHKDSGR